MHFSTALTAFALIAASYGQSLYVQNDLSFGNGDRMSPDLHQIPKFTLMGDQPQIYSNKIILTPPSPGNKRAAVWSENTLTDPKWDITLQFRATGPERASGRLHLWLVKDGVKAVGTSSIYTAGKFEGLAIVIDQYANTGGMIRAFLNDGTKHYGQHLSVDSLAFGHAEFPYRNLGRPSKVRVQQDWHNFRVEVDGALAFETSTVRIPPGYNIGVGAASADSPDSFEVFSLLTTTDSVAEGATSHNVGSAYDHSGDAAYSPDTPPSNEPRSDEPQHSRYDPADPSKHTATGYLARERIPHDSEIKPLPASAISTDQEFTDLHYRTQALMAHMLAFQADFQGYQVEATRRHAGMLEQYAKANEHTQGRPFPYDTIDSLDRRMQAMEKLLAETRRDIAGAGDRVERLRQQLLEGHGAILAGVHGSVGTLAGHLPRLGWVIFVVLGSQAGIVVAFLWYKRRKAVGPKKYL